MHLIMYFDVTACMDDRVSYLEQVPGRISSTKSPQQVSQSNDGFLAALLFLVWRDHGWFMVSILSSSGFTITHALPPTSSRVGGHSFRVGGHSSRLEEQLSV